jgi:hypothetical protein
MQIKCNAFVSSVPDTLQGSFVTLNRTNGIRKTVGFPIGCLFPKKKDCRR